MSDGYTLHITNAPPDWHEKLHELVAQLPAETITSDPVPTVEAAVNLIERTTLDAIHLLRLAVQGDGRALGADFRAQRGEGRLNGATTSLTRAVKALIKQGIWPESVPEVITSTKAGPEGWRKTHAYYMPPALVSVFRAAFLRIDPRPPGDPQATAGHLTTTPNAWDDLPEAIERNGGYLPMDVLTLRNLDGAGSAKVHVVARIEYELASRKIGHLPSGIPRDQHAKVLLYNQDRDNIGLVLHLVHQLAQGRSDTATNATQLVSLLNLRLAATDTTGATQ
ncbi:hypothetical protein ACWDZ4_20375 [Streptomyces sp. NPDC003016]